jgi:RND family efflux transporter MFP subunit
MKKTTNYLIAAAVVLAAGGLFYFKVYLPKTTFETVKAERKSMDDTVFGIGQVDAKNIYPLGAQTGGKILEILVDEGDWVKKGDLIASIDPVDMPQLLDEAKISGKKARLEVEASLKELESLRAQKRLAQMTYDRYEKLKDQGYAAQAEYDKARADLQSLDAQIAATLARIDASKIEIHRAEKNVEALRQRLARLKVYAPVDGLVIARDAQPAQTVAPTQPIVRVVDPKTVWIKAWIDEHISGNVKVGQRARITLRSKSDHPYEGKVVRIGATSDPITQEREVDVAFDRLPIPFYLNEQAEVLIRVGTFENAVTVPAHLIQHRDGKAGVWVDEGGTARYVPVTVRAIDGGTAAVDGLKPGTRVLVPAADKKPLREGMKVRG